MSVLTGRRVLKSEVAETALSLLESCEISPCMLDNGKTIQCLRCGTIHEKEDVFISCDLSNESLYYCPECIQLGRVDSHSVFYYSPQVKKIPRETHELVWEGILTTSQHDVSKRLVEIVGANTTFLVWAVTGAGKTEMLFQSVLSALNEGQRVCIASPRVDVCLELFPRFKQVFPSVDIMLLHGKQEEEYRETPFVICTTHQLLRFYRAFDYLVIDEVDAFPYQGNAMLRYGMEHSLQKNGTLIYLTATPPRALQELATSSKIASAIVSARYHRKPLVEPQLIWMWNWERVQTKQTLSGLFIRKIKFQIKQSIPTLIFCPTIQLVKCLTTLIHKKFPDISVACVYGQDTERIEKVQKMRDGQFDILVTTTILERGVTFTGIDVIVYGANHRVFTEAALVQIAGRVGRTAARTDGDVYFVHSGYSAQMNRAVSQIKRMNRLARKKGLLD